MSLSIQEITINAPITMGFTGPAGPEGSNFTPDAVGLLSELGDYDSEDAGFSFLALDTGDIYFRYTATAGTWSDPIPFISTANTPEFTAFGITGYTADQFLEIGTSLVSPLTFTWSSLFPASIATNSIEITSPAGSTVLATGLANDGAQTVSVSAPVTSPLTSAGKTFRIEATSNGETFSRDFALRAGHPLFYGKASGSRPTIDGVAVAAGTKLVVDTEQNVTIPFASGADEWIWFALPVASPIPVSWAELENPANVGTIGGATEVGGNLFPAAGSAVSVTTANWSGVSYRVYVSNRKLATGVGALVVGDVQAWAQATVIASSATTDRLNALDLPGVDPTGATDSTAALQAAITALGTNPLTRELFFPPGTYKFNLLVPEQVRIVGAGFQISASESKSSATVFMPQNDALPVLWVKSVFSNYFSDFEMLGNGSGASSTGLGSSVAGLRVKNDADNYPGMGLVCERVKAERFAIGFQLSKMNSVTFRDCSAVYNGTGWKGEALSDTWLLHNCHGDYNEDFQIWINEPRSVTVVGGDWGNCSCPLALVQGGGVMIFEGANIESVVNTHLFEAVNSHLILRGNRITPQTTGAALTAAIVRQTTSNGQVTFDNNRIEGFTNVGSFGFPLAWETNDAAAPAPVFVTRFGGICQLKSSDFSTVTRSWHSEHVGFLAYRTTNQTIASGAYAVVTWSADQNDLGQNFDHSTGVFTAPVTGWYVMSVSLVVSEANSGYTRINERLNGTNASILDSANNHEAFRPLVGSRVRYLSAGHTWAVAIFHNKGSNMTVRGTGAAEDSTLSIAKL